MDTMVTLSTGEKVDAYGKEFNGAFGRGIDSFKEEKIGENLPFENGETYADQLTGTQHALGYSMTHLGSIDTTYLQEDEIPVVGELLQGKGIKRPFGDYMAIKLFQDSEKTKGGIFLPDVSKDNNMYNTVSGLVVGLGPDCFKTGKYEHSNEPGCKVGDWVVFSYKVPNRFKYKGLTLVYTYDDSLLAIVDDPSEIKRG